MLNLHSSGGDEKQWASANLVDEETLTGGNDDVQDLQATVDDQLDVAVGDSDRVEDKVQVVADKTVARPL